MVPIMLVIFPIIDLHKLAHSVRLVAYSESVYTCAELHVCMYALCKYVLGRASPCDLLAYEMTTISHTIHIICHI